MISLVGLAAHCCHGLVFWVSGSSRSGPVIANATLQPNLPFFLEYPSAREQALTKLDLRERTKKSGAVRDTPRDNFCTVITPYKAVHSVRVSTALT